MPVLSIRRCENKLIDTSGFFERSLELAREVWREPLVVFGVDPEHGHTGVLAEVLEGIDDRVLIAEIPFAVTTATSREVDRGLEPHGWLGCERHLSKAACGDACTHDRVGVHLGQVLSRVVHGRAQIVRGGFAGIPKAAIRHAAAAVFRVLLASGGSVPASYDYDGDVAPARKPERLRQHPPRVDAHAFLRLAGGPMRQ